MIYFISLKEFFDLIERYHPGHGQITREGFFHTSPNWTYEKGRNLLKEDLPRMSKDQIGLLINGNTIKTLDQFDAATSATLNKDFISHYGQILAEPTRLLYGQNLDFNLRQDKYIPPNIDSARITEIRTSPLESKLITTIDKFCLRNDLKPNIPPTKISGKLQSHSMITAAGVQLIGVLSTSSLLHDLLSSQKMISAKSFFARVAKEKQEASESGPITAEKVQKQLLALASVDSKNKLATFIKACNQLLIMPIDEFWLSLIEQLIQLIPNSSFDMSVSTFFKPNKDIAKESIRKSLAIVELDESLCPLSAKSTLNQVIESMLSRTTADKPYYHPIRCMQLYLQSATLFNPALIAFNEFVKQFCNQEELKRLQSITELQAPENLQRATV